MRSASPATTPMRSGSTARRWRASCARISAARTHRAAAPEYYAQADPARVPPRSLAVIAVVVAAVLIVGYLLWRRTLVEEPATIPVAEAPARPAAGAAARTHAAGRRRPAGDAGGDRRRLAARSPTGRAALSSTWAAWPPATATSSRRPPSSPLIRTGRPQNLRALLGTRDLGPLAAPGAGDREMCPASRPAAAPPPAAAALARRRPAQ